MLIVVGKVI